MILGIVAGFSFGVMVLGVAKIQHLDSVTMCMCRTTMRSRSNASFSAQIVLIHCNTYPLSSLVPYTYLLPALSPYTYILSLSSLLTYLLPSLPHHTYMSPTLPLHIFLIHLPIITITTDCILHAVGNCKTHSWTNTRM